MCSVCYSEARVVTEIFSQVRASTTEGLFRLGILSVKEKFVSEKQEAKPLPHGGPFYLSQALERLWQWEYCPERK